MRALMNEGVDPSKARKQDKLAPVVAAEESARTAESTFEAVGRVWMATQDVAEITTNKNRWLPETFLFPKLGKRPVGEITPREPNDEIANALYAILRVVGSVAHFEDVIGKECSGKRFEIFNRIAGRIADDLAELPNSALATTLLRLISQQPNPEKPRPMLKIVR